MMTNLKFYEFTIYTQKNPKQKTTKKQQKWGGWNKTIKRNIEKINLVNVRVQNHKHAGVHCLGIQMCQSSDSENIYS